MRAIKPKVELLQITPNGAEVIGSILSQECPAVFDPEKYAVDVPGQAYVTYCQGEVTDGS